MKDILYFEYTGNMNVESFVNHIVKKRNIELVSYDFGLIKNNEDRKYLKIIYK